jgi:receptor protein-tyrosine kinase
MGSQGEIDIRRIATALRRRWKTTLTVWCAVVVLAAVATMLKTPQYESTAVLLLGERDGTEARSMQEMNQAAGSLSLMAEDVSVAETASALAGIDTDSTDLVERVSTNVPADTQRIEISVRDSDPRTARDNAVAITDSFKELVAQRGAAPEGLALRTWQHARLPNEPVSPNVVRTMAAAVALGLALGLLIAVLREHFDARWRSERDIEIATGLPVLATIDGRAMNFEDEEVLA